MQVYGYYETVYDIETTVPISSKHKIRDPLSGQSLCGYAGSDTITTATLLQSLEEVLNIEATT